MTKRLERISRRAVVKLGGVGALLVSAATAGVALLVEACSSDDKKSYGYGDYGYYYSRYNNDYYNRKPKKKAA